jgi:hypothetical protein
METNAPTVVGSARSEGSEVGSARRRKRAQDNQNIRFFLLKAGSSPAKPELGQEMTSESAALIEALKSGQPFYLVTTWKAVAEVNGGTNPIIVKEPLVKA